MPNPTEPHPLKGITCTNDDPDSCALCCKVFPDGPIHVFSSGVKNYIIECCGKRLCGDCCLYQSNASLGDAVTLKCKCCPANYSLELKKKAATLKRQAKKGRVWAQFILATYCDFRGDKYAAVHLLRSAVKGGHPDAMLCLAEFVCQGGGCKKDLVEAESLLDRCIAATPRLLRACVHGYTKIVVQYMELGTPETGIRAESILLPLAKDGHHLAQYQLGKVYQITEDFDAARMWCTEAIFNAETTKQRDMAAFEVLFSSLALSDFPQAKVWADVVKSTGFLDPRFDNSDDAAMRTARVIAVIKVRRGLLDLRKSCATCCVSLDRTTRKLCKGCKAHCYCSTQCQEKHWNEAEGGHRAECKGAQALKKRIKDENLLEKWIKK